MADHHAKPCMCTTSVANPEYEVFDPQLEWVIGDGGTVTILIFLSGFLKDRLKTQIKSTRKLRVSGERPMGSNKWLRFVKELPIPHDSDANRISAKFEGGILYIKFPKPVPVCT